MSKIQINFDDLQDFATQLGKAANKCDEALGHINVDLYSLLANIPGVASKNIHELETIFESNLKKYKKNLVKAQHLMRLTEAIMSETERKLARKAREIVQENSWDSTHLLMVDKNTLAPQIYGSHQQDSSTKLTDEQVKGLRNYIRQLKDGEIVSNLDAYRAMPEDNSWQGNIYPSNPGVKPEVDHITKALGKFAFDFLVGDVVTILNPEALTEDKLIAAAMMLPPAKVVKLVAKLKDLEKMKDTIDNLDDVSDKVKDTSDNLQDASKGEGTTNFGSISKLEGHFAKHGGEFKGVYTNADEYLQGARDVINIGYKVQYQYKGEIRKGYVKFMATNKKGISKFEFVGTNNLGEITTYHVESGKDFWKMINGQNIPVINPID